MSEFAQKHRNGILTAAVLATLGSLPSLASADTYNWTQNATGTFNWNDTAPSNWTTGFPNAAGDVVNLNTDLTGGESVYLRQDITIGHLNIGDASAAANNFGFLIGNYPGTAGPPVVPADPNYVLTFDSGVVGTPSQINLGVTGTPTNTIATPVVLNSGLAINMGPTGSLSNTARQNLSFTGPSITAGSNNITISGGFSTLGNPGASGSGVSIAAATSLTGSGVFTIGGRTRLDIAGAVPTDNSTGVVAKSFAGKVVVNSTVNGTNAGSLVLLTGSLANTSEIVLNGQFAGLGTNGAANYGTVLTPGGAGNAGAVLQVGSGSAQNYLPGQRLTSNTLTFNGGTLSHAGQNVANGAGLWVQDVVATANFNSGESFVTMGASTSTTAGTRITATSMTRGEGATLHFRPGSVAGTTQFVAGNGTSFLKSEVASVPGAGTAGTTTVGIIPWMALGSTSGYAMNTFATYDTTAAGGSVVGLRALAATEFTGTLTADSNFRGTAIALGASDISVNSLQYTSASATATNIGAGRTITIKSGGLMLTGGPATGAFTGGIGQVGNAAAGTLAFGAAEAVIFNGYNVSSGGGISGNTIGAAITGTGGLTKSGTGVLVLAGTNSITGDTHVSNGALKVGDGTVNSSIGDGDVFVHGGTVLDLVYAGATANTVIDFIDDSSALNLKATGELFGRLSIFAGIDTVSSLVLGDAVMAPGYYGSAAAAVAHPSLSVSTFGNYFLGDGLIQVVAVPEPTSLGVMTIGTAALLGRLRRRNA